jgi:hypothetical protein
LCGSGTNASICFASVDRAGKLSPEDRTKLGSGAPVAIDIVSAPQFTAELAAFHAALPPRWVKGNRYWREFDPVEATAAIRGAFAGLHIDTRGGAKARKSAEFGGNLAYESSASTSAPVIVRSCSIAIGSTGRWALWWRPMCTKRRTRAAIRTVRARRATGNASRPT